MGCLAIAVNLMPIFLATPRVGLGGSAGLSGEPFGRGSAVTFAGLVVGILFTVPLADRWGGKLLLLLDFRCSFPAGLLCSLARGASRRQRCRRVGRRLPTAYHAWFRRRPLSLEVLPPFLNCWPLLGTWEEFSGRGSLV